MPKLRFVHLDKVNIEFTGMSDRSKMIKVKKILSIKKTKWSRIRWNQNR